MKAGGSSRRSARLLLVAGSGVLAALVIAVVLVVGGRDEKSAPLVQASDWNQCRVLPEAQARACYIRAFTAIVSGHDDPRPVVAAIADSAWREGGFVLSNCHGVMHTVGRTYARAAGVSLATLMDYLPKSNDPGCSAGFAHGLVTGVGPDIDVRDPRESTAVCASAETRYQRYSCVHGFGHAFMRINGGELAAALDRCRALGSRAAPDCAQGAYHDYWFAVVGVDEAQLPEDPVRDPRKLCAEQPRAFVRPCWYRAFVDNRPGFEIRSADDLDALCDGLSGLQRQACITAASVIGPPEPALQLQLCAGLGEPSDAESCIRGVKVQNLLGGSTARFVELIGRCESFAVGSRAACYRWLGKALAVLTDGEFGRAGCPRLATAAARRDCRVGARRLNEALVTFS